MDDMDGMDRAFEGEGGFTERFYRTINLFGCAVHIVHTVHPVHSFKKPQLSWLTNCISAWSALLTPIPLPMIEKVETHDVEQ